MEEKTTTLTDKQVSQIYNKLDDDNNHAKKRLEKVVDIKVMIPIML